MWVLFPAHFQGFLSVSGLADDLDALLGGQHPSDIGAKLHHVIGDEDSDSLTAHELEGISSVTGLLAGLGREMRTLDLLEHFMQLLKPFGTTRNWYHFIFLVAVHIFFPALDLRSKQNNHFVVRCVGGAGLEEPAQNRELGKDRNSLFRKRFALLNEAAQNGRFAVIHLYRGHDTALEDVRGGVGTAGEAGFVLLDEDRELQSVLVDIQVADNQFQRGFRCLVGRVALVVDACGEVNRLPDTDEGQAGITRNGAIGFRNFFFSEIP